eukprot:g7155.t1
MASIAETDALKVLVASGYNDVMPQYLVEAARIFQRIDRNNDGTLQKDELILLVGGQKATFMMNDLDTNHDGSVSPAEWSTYWAKCHSAGRNVTGMLNWLSKQCANMEATCALHSKDNQPPKLTRVKSATDIPVIMERATSLFLQIDTDNSNSLSKDELMIVLRSDERVKAAFKSLDTDKDGQISVTEFCNWCIRTYTNEGSEKVFQQLEYIEGLLSDNVETVLKPTKLKRQASATDIPEILTTAASIFLRIDADHSGELDREELLKFAKNNNDVVANMLHDLDVNKDGKVSVSEWQKFFIKCYSTVGANVVLKHLENINSQLD